jgi:hypothetical protein
MQHPLLKISLYKSMTYINFFRPCGKQERGGSIFLNKPRSVSAEEWEAFQPERIY